MADRIYRSRTERKIAGVCGGLAEYFDVDPSLVRILFVALVFFNGFGFLAYLVCWLVLPEAPQDVVNAPIESQSSAASFKAVPTTVQSSKRWVTGIGVLLIAIGFAMLIERFVPWLDVGDLIPYALIVGGLLLLYRGWIQNRHQQQDAHIITEKNHAT
ncbi:MAG: PspC domain-containing protein [Chlorobi bacterium]|nr:PspC domain-containing protein [Chlorobiota bacterium]